MAQQNEPLVISRTEEGFRVYSPVDPTKSYIVGGGPEEPTCTCPEFQYHEGDPKWHCLHIQAVLQQLCLPNASGNGADPYDAVERAAIQAENGLPEKPANGAAPQMTLKRSVSPDGRIDSLSVEFSSSVGEVTAGEIKDRALKTLQLQTEIVASFLNGNGKPNGSSPRHANGAAPAQMLNIGGITTKWGRRLYIAIQSNGQALKLFGSRKQLAEALVAAGYPRQAERIDEGTALNLACRVVTRPSEDGKYINVVEVLPAQARGWQ